jgi:glycosyltransferase involved in cell wall biosynthesis
VTAGDGANGAPPDSDGDDAPLVSVIVPARDAAATVRATLQGLEAQRIDEPYEVIVVDDGSRDGTASLAEGFAPLVRVVRTAGAGPGPARNAGAREARGSILAFTDADCVPTPGWLRAGMDALGDADLVQGRVEPDPGAHLSPFDHTVWVVGESGLYETANLFVRGDLFERLGGFEDFLGARIGKPLAEDLWLGWRARRAGARTAFSSDALVHHAVLPRGPAGYVGERLRLVYFPAIANRVPELRESLFFRHFFLTRRSAAFDLALAGVAVAVLKRSPPALLAAAPYAVQLARYGRRWRSARVAAVEGGADAVGFAALAWGSVRSRSPVL